MADARRFDMGPGVVLGGLSWAAGLVGWVISGSILWGIVTAMAAACLMLYMLSVSLDDDDD